MDGAPRLFYRAPSVIERDLFEGEVSGVYRAPRIFPWDLQAAFAAGLLALLADNADEAARIAELAQMESAGESLDPIAMADLTRARDLVGELWPPYQSMIAQAARRDSVVPVLAFRRFVTGWDGLEDDDGAIPFARGLDGFIPDSALQRIAPMIIRVLGIEIYNGMYLTKSAEKNSAQESK